VGLIQRAVEASGIATISISLSKHITKKLRPPRALYPGFSLGHPVGFPGQVAQQLKILDLLLQYLKEITVPGTLIELDLKNVNDIGNIAMLYGLKAN